MTAKSEDEKKLNEKYILYQVLAQNIESLKQQMQIVEEQIIGIKSTLNTLNDLKTVKEKNEIFLPIGSGCFGKGMLMENDRMLVNVGSGIFLEKSIDDAKAFLEERLKEIEKAGKDIEAYAEKIALQMNELAEDIQNLAQKISKEEK
jgi:prefoldin alpha subunit